MKKLLIIIAITAVFASFSNAQTLIAHRDSVAEAYNFWVYVPETYDSINQTTPTILFLHGQSLCGRNLTNVRRYGPLDALKMGRAIDAVVVAPQNPGGTWNPKKIMNVIDWTTQKYHTDTSRLYVYGMSLGGFGTIDFVSAYPEKVAAAMALCGGGTAKDVCGLNQVPLWIMHGTADRAVGIGQSQQVVDKMIACGDTSLLIFDRMKGVNHSQLARLFYMPETYEWLFSHSLNDSVRQVNRNITINTSTMELAYKNFDKSRTLKVVDPNPSANSTFVADPNAKYHIVQKGDSLWQISRSYHTTVAKLCQLNNLTENSILQIGQKIYVQ